MNIGGNAGQTAPRRNAYLDSVLIGRNPIDIRIQAALEETIDP